MYCPRCGEILCDDARFCNRCGLQLYAGPSISDGQQYIVVQPRKSYSWVWAIVIVCIVLFFGLWGLFSLGKPILLSYENNRHINFVKNGSPASYPNITYDEAFSNFFANRHWEYFKSDDGYDVVEFTGDCLYRDAEVTVTLQFILDVDEETFEAGYLAFNGVPQSMIVEYVLLEKVFESYP